MSISIKVAPNKPSTSHDICMWSLSGHHYGDKETMDNILTLILHQVQSNIYWCCTRGDGTQGGFTIKVPVTRRP